MSLSLGSLKTLNKEKKYLLAISGGVDSMVLLHLFLYSQLKFSVVHCNFQLREEESDLDEQLVLNFCKKNNVEIFTKKFNTLELKKNRESIEMLARNIRYEYFNELLQTHSFDYLVTAHHLNDNVETFFINLLRGSGLKGLAGMQVLSHQILRPLLSYSRKEILDFALENAIIWREDQTNQTLDYLRNKIRHTVIPDLEEINPAFLNQAKKSMEILYSSQYYIEKKTEELKLDATLSTKNNTLTFSQDKLQNSDFILVYHLLSQYGFSKDKDCRNILKSKTGSFFESQTHKIWNNRDQFIIETLENSSESTKVFASIETLPFIIEKPLYLKIVYSKEKVSNENYEVIDFDTISFPLTLRNWKEGDCFYPINGNGKKKISKYLKDEKVSNLEKKKTLILCDASGSIIWLVNFRLDDRFKITDKSKEFVHLYLI